MNDYFTQRAAELQGTLDRIDIATTPCCWSCGHMLRGDEPSDLFCSVSCHNTGVRYTADPDVATALPVDGLEWTGATTRAQARKRDQYRQRYRQTEPTGPATRDVLFQRVHLNRATPARHILMDAPDHTNPGIGVTAEEVQAVIEHATANIHEDIINNGIPLRITEPMTIGTDQHGDPMYATDGTRLGEATIRVRIPAPTRTRLDETHHKHHRREHRGGYALWVLAIAVAGTAGFLTTSDSWPVTVIAAVGAAWAAWLAWVSVGNARASAATCPICHPPCDTDPTTR